MAFVRLIVGRASRVSPVRISERRMTTEYTRRGVLKLSPEYACPRFSAKYPVTEHSRSELHFAAIGARRCRELQDPEWVQAWGFALSLGATVG